MSTPTELTAEFWKALKSDRTVMLSLTTDRVHPKPMTGLIEGDSNGPVWFFTAVDTELAESIKAPRQAMFALASKDHELFATIHGRITHDADPAVIDRLWNPFVAAWYEKGKDDPKLALLRFDVEDGEIWRNASSLFAGVKAVLGIDPKTDYRDDVATVKLKNATT